MATTTSAKRQAGAAVKRAKGAAAAAAEELSEEAMAAGRQAGLSRDDLVRGAEDFVASVGETLKSVGVDTDRMADVAREQATDLQQLIAKEVQERPLRALGIAAAVGLFVGFLSAR